MNRPADPITYLSLFLLANNPNKDLEEKKDNDQSDQEEDSDTEYFEEF
jgi:hypothetical protein